MTPYPHPTLARLLAFGIAAFLSSGAAFASDHLVRFDGGIGVIPVSNAAGADPTGLATRNVVRTVLPGGQPWVIAKLRADVRTDGRIRVKGEGLLLAGGNNIGFNGGASVYATLFCSNDGNIEHNTTVSGVPLEPNGDFNIEDNLSPVPPGVCTSPVLLIRTANGGRWFAAGIPKD